MPEDIREQFHELERRREVAEGLRGILAVLNSNQPLAAVLEYITLCAGQLLHADAVAIYRLYSDSGMQVVQSSHGLSEEYLKNSTIRLGEGATGRAVLLGKPVVIPSVEEILANQNETHSQDIVTVLSLLSKQYHAVLSVPIVIKQEITGALTLYYLQPREFDLEEIALAVSFCDQVALAIENARLRDKIQQEAVAAERNRLARDLHDSVTQTIFSASLIADVLPAVWNRDEEVGKQGLAELRKLVRGALAEMRTLLLELRPADLTGVRLEDLLTQLGEGISGRMGSPVRLHIKGVAVLPPDIKLTFYRIAQEALNNAAKHAAAGLVEIELSSTPSSIPQEKEFTPSYSQSVSMCIRDNGVGFDPENITGDHLGLNIMRERAAQALAAIAIQSKPGQGTEISLTWNNPGLADPM